MLRFYWKLAISSLLRTPLLSAVAVAAVGLGVAVPTAILSIHHVFARNPIPAKSDRLFNVRVDSWGTATDFFDIRPGEPPKHITYRDMRGLMESDLPVRATGVANARTFVFPEGSERRPYQTAAQLCHADFFAMFEAPFRFGGPWGPAADERRERVVVLSREANDSLFGGADSVGRTLRIGAGVFAVAGVLDEWRPQPRYFDILNNPFGPPRELFVPFDTVREQGLGFARFGQSDSWSSVDTRANPDAFFTASETTWIQYWVELEPDRVAAFRDWVDAYARDQKSLGRFPRPINNRVTPVMEWLEVRQVVPPATRGLVLISVLFLLVCCLNLSGLLLAKFMARAGLAGVHRALGAPRSAIFAQRLLESEAVALAGGVVGLAMAAGAVRMINGWLPAFILPPDLFRLDGYMLAAAFALSLLAGLLAGVYPAWRACRVAPALQIKVQ